MTKFLDTYGLYEYHTQNKANIDSSFNTMQNGDIGLSSAISELTADAGLPPMITNKINVLVDNATMLKLTTSLSTVLVGNSTDVDITATCKRTCQRIVIKNGIGDIITMGSGNSVDDTVTVSPSAEGILGFTAEATTIDGMTYTAKVYLNCVPKIYYGGGSTYADASTYATPRLTPKGDYDVTVALGDYIIFCIPATMQISNITMSGMSVPMDVSSQVIGGISYIVYKSQSQFQAGTYTITVS